MIQKFGNKATKYTGSYFTVVKASSCWLIINEALWQSQAMLKIFFILYMSFKITSLMSQPGPIELTITPQIKGDSLLVYLHGGPLLKMDTHWCHWCTCIGILPEDNELIMIIYIHVYIIHIYLYICSVLHVLVLYKGTQHIVAWWHHMVS